MSTPESTSSSRLSTAEILSILALGFGLAITVLDPTLVSLNVTRIERGLDVPGHLIGFVGSIATLTLAAAVLGATSMGDLFGRKRLYVWGLLGTILFDLLAVFAPNTWALIVLRTLDGVALALLLVRRAARGLRRSVARFWSTTSAGAACSSSPRSSRRSRSQSRSSTCP